MHHRKSSGSKKDRANKKGTTDKTSSSFDYQDSEQEHFVHEASLLAFDNNVKLHFLRAPPMRRPRHSRSLDEEILAQAKQVGKWAGHVSWFSRHEVQDTNMHLKTTSGCIVATGYVLLSSHVFTMFHRSCSALPSNSSWHWARQRHRYCPEPCAECLVRLAPRRIRRDHRRVCPNVGPQRTLVQPKKPIQYAKWASSPARSFKQGAVQCCLSL